MNKPASTPKTYGFSTDEDVRAFKRAADTFTRQMIASPRKARKFIDDLEKRAGLESPKRSDRK